MGNEHNTATYTLRKDQNNTDLPEFLLCEVLPQCDIESVVITYKARDSEMRYRVEQLA